ncbi:hypothetical protein N9L68_05700, partial [bacterium]|nr:hypothetical protein [bacterium]
MRPITLRGKQALAAALRAGGASSSSIRDVRDVQHPSGEVPLHIRLQEEYERVTGDRGRLQEKRGGYVCPGYPQCEIMDCDCPGPQSEEEQEEGGAADWKDDLRNWETMCDDSPETVKESDGEDKEKGKEEEHCLCSSAKEKAKDKEERGKGSGTTRDAGCDAGDCTPRPKPSNKRWHILVPSNFRRCSQPYSNNCHWYTKYDVVLPCDR